MSKKASPHTAISTISPLESCKLVVAVFHDQASNIRKGLIQDRLYRPNVDNLPACKGMMRLLGVPNDIAKSALAGRITSLQDVEIAILTHRLTR